MSFLNKIVDDTLKTPSGRWSRHSLTFFASFVISVILGGVLTGLSFFLNITVNPIAENVFNSFMTLTGVMSGTTIWNKMVEAKKVKENE